MKLQNGLTITENYLRKGQTITRPDFEIISEVVPQCLGGNSECGDYKTDGDGVCYGCYQYRSYCVTAIGYGLKIYHLIFNDKNNLKDFQIIPTDYDGKMTVNLIKDVIEEDVRRMCQESLAIKWYYNEEQVKSIQGALIDIMPHLHNDYDFAGCRPIYEEDYKSRAKEIMRRLADNIDDEIRKQNETQ